MKPVMSAIETTTTALMARSATTHHAERGGVRVLEVRGGMFFFLQA